MKRFAIAALAAASLSGFAHARDIGFKARPSTYAAETRHDWRAVYDATDAPVTRAASRSGRLLCDAQPDRGHARHPPLASVMLSGWIKTYRGRPCLDPSQPTSRMSCPSTSSHGRYWRCERPAPSSRRRRREPM